MFTPCVIGSKLSMSLGWLGGGGVGMMFGGYFPFISWCPPSGCFLLIVVAPTAWTGKRGPCRPLLVALQKDERGVGASGNVRTSARMKF